MRLGGRNDWHLQIFVLLYLCFFGHVVCHLPMREQVDRGVDAEKSWMVEWKLASVMGCEELIAKLVI